MDKKEEIISIDRALYKKIKGFNKDQMSSFLTDVYKSAAEETMNGMGTASIDLEKLREEIGKVKGVGENRLNEIMEVIQKAVAQ